MSLQAAALSLDITPPPGLELGGGAFGRAQGTMHPLQAQVLVAGNGVTTLVLITSDTLGFDVPYARRVRQSVAQAAGTTADAVMLTGTHTHNAPATVPLRNWGQPDPDYREDLLLRLTRAAADLAGRLQPVRLRAGHTPCAGVNVNRCGSGVPDDVVSLLRFETDDGAPVAWVVNHACHPVNLHSSGLQTPDFVHYLRLALQSADDNPPTVLFLQGASGDLLPANFEKKPDDACARATGEQLAQSVLQARPALDEAAEDALGYAAQDVALPLQALPSREQIEALLAERSAALESYPTPSATDWKYTSHKTAVEWAQEALQVLDSGQTQSEWKVPLQAFRFGSAGIVGIPGELFSAFGRRLREAAEPQVLLIGCLANGCCGYFATREAHELGSYEAAAACRYIGLYPLAENAGEVMTAAAQELRQSLCCRPGTP
jgi:hypothetical protein